MLSDAQVDAFVTDGFVRIDGAFPAQIAAECREIIWRDIGADPGDPSTWPSPVAGLGDLAQPPFRTAADTPRLHAAFDILVGPGRWIPRDDLGGFVVRFPGGAPARVDGWHIDASFPGDDLEPGSTDYMRWRVNVESRDCALRMFFLLSDTGQDDAPTRLRVGSHLDAARVLEPEGEKGLDARELARRVDAATAHRPLAFATGDAGDVYLCHPFLVHAGQPHHGTRPRFLGQPKLTPAVRLGGGSSPVETAIRRGLGR
ncbi:phytanoyl-CoA dioxygenase [Actinomadura cremea]|nr:phytanoyl-CoA dioxygenase [Actinomadura cremea]